MQATDVDSEMMREAIHQAQKCNSTDPAKPKVGAIIAIGGTIIGQGSRGEDHHAERNAIASVVNTAQLAKATLYTTLEPCTPDVRSDPLTCCTALIQQYHFQRVFIGILDPNQAVRGKGLWNLQTHGIDVELFPPDLANEIRILNADFIRFQQSLGLQITNAIDGQEIRTWNNNGIFDLEGTYENPPQSDTFALSFGSGRWYFQPHPVRVIDENHKRWSTRFHFGDYNPHTLYIVKANELGVVLVNYYRKVTSINTDRTKRLKEKFPNEEAFLKTLPGDYPGIEMGKLPKGLEMQARVDVILEQPPK